MGNGGLGLALFLLPAQDDEMIVSGQETTLATSLLRIGGHGRASATGQGGWECTKIKDG